MSDAPALPLPMFPLGTVLFPHTVIPLHIFEPRYRALARDCTKGDGRFGVVLIERGSEVGGGDSRFSVGTAARIVESAELPDGRWLIAAIGTRRLRIQTWLPDDPYPLALVVELEDRPLEEPDASLLAKAEQVVRRGLAYQAELGEHGPSPTVELDEDPTRAAFQLAALAPIGPIDRQRLLEEDDPRRRLERLIEAAGDAAALLAFRLTDGGPEVDG